MTRPVLFFVRNQPDIDHVAPILFRLAKEGVPATVVCRNLLYDAHADYRLRFLKEEYGIPCFNLLEAMCGTVFGRMAAGMIRRLLRIRRFSLGQWLEKAAYRMLDRPGLLDRVFSRFQPSAAAFDYASKPVMLTGVLCEAAKKRGIPTALVPHGNGMRETGWKAEKNMPDADFRVVQNAHNVRKYDDGKTPESAFKLLGCARYCDEWMNIHNRLVAEKFPAPWLPDAPDKLKVLVFDRPKIGFDEGHSTVSMLRGLGFTEVLFKGKPREKGGKAIPLLSLPSARLVQWADVVVMSISGIAFEALRQKKPVIYLKFLAPDDGAVFERFGACKSVNSEAELADVLRALHNDRTMTLYPPENVDTLFEDFVCGGQPGRDVLGDYMDFFRSL